MTAGMSIDLAQRVSVLDILDVLATNSRWLAAGRFALSDRIWVRDESRPISIHEAGLAGLHDPVASFRGTALCAEVDLQDTPRPLTPLQATFITSSRRSGLTNGAARPGSAPCGSAGMIATR